jgi:hypothetical protein
MGGVTWPCPVGGIDIGSALQTIYAFSYGTFFTVPLLLLTLPIWAVVELFHLLRAGVHSEPRR